jgi:hypothetical protein
MVYKHTTFNRIDGVMIRVLDSSAVDGGFKCRSGQTKDYEIGICCLSAKHAALSNFSAKSWREQVNFQWDGDVVHFVLDQHAQLDFNSASSLKQQSAGAHVF